MKNSSVPSYRPGPINDVQDIVDEINRINEMVRIATESDIKIALNQYKHEQEAQSKTAAKK